MTFNRFLLIIALCISVTSYWFFHMNKEQVQSPGVKKQVPPTVVKKKFSSSDKHSAPDKLPSDRSASDELPSDRFAANSVSSASTPYQADGDYIIDPHPEKIIETIMEKSENTTDEEIRRNKIETLFSMVEEAEQLEDYDRAFALLIAMKDVAVGEDLQSILKKMYNYGEKGGNEEIINTFISSDSLPEGERFRMLTYLNPEYPLSVESVTVLKTAYSNAESDPLRSVVVDTFAAIGGEEGISWLVDKAENTSDYSEWYAFINALGRSQSTTAFEYLHSSLDALAAESPNYNEYTAVLRDAITSFDVIQE